MITNLHIKNIGIIDDIEINLNSGLNVLTGETGAGKSLIIDSIDIICGGRFSKEMIRKGEDFSFVEMCLFVPGDDNSIDGNIIVSREVYSNGRNLCKVNGRLVTVAELRSFMSRYIEIHGQNDNQTILDNRTHINYLDNYIGDDISLLKNEYKSYYEEYLDICKDIKNNYGDEKEKQRKLDLLRYQAMEIEEARLKEGEEEKLEEKRQIFMNSEKIFDCLNTADSSINEGTIDNISYAVRALEKIESIDKKYADFNNNLKNIYYELQELSREVVNSKRDIEFNEEDRNSVEQRLDLIASLKRKYGNTIKEILNYYDDISSEIKKIENIDEYIDKLNKRKSEIEGKMNDIAKKIHTLREEKSKILSDQINKNLTDLEMKNAKINIYVEFNIDAFFYNGKDEVEFFIATNIGEDEKPLMKIASGGEMSRIMLAIKKVLADTDSMPVLIFDEIDTGISGKAANSVAEKLKIISNAHQVICISHLANIAAIADYNYFINKKVCGQRTNTNVKLLNEKEVIEEIARISSGDVNELSLKYAENLRIKMVS